MSILVACPACQAEMTLDVLIPLEEGRVAVGQVLERSMGLGGVAMRYLALFRPGKRRMSISRLCGLVAELLPDIERRAITRKGRDWLAPADTWRAAMDVVLAKRDAGTLTLPLTGHGLLYEVICGLADRAERAAEQQREEERRNRRHDGPRAEAPRNLAGMLEAATGVPSLQPTGATPAPYLGPSKAALETRARIEAGRRARGLPAPDVQTGGAS